MKSCKLQDFTFFPPFQSGIVMRILMLSRTWYGIRQNTEGRSRIGRRPAGLDPGDVECEGK